MTPRLGDADLALSQDLLDEYHFLAADRSDRLGASFLRNEDAPDRHDANHVRRIRLDAEADVDAFFAEVERFYAGLPFRSLRVGPFTTPLAVEARLLHEGYRQTPELVMAANGPLAGRAADIEIVKLEGEAGWRTLQALLDADRDSAAAAAEQTGRLNRRRGDAYTWFLAMADGRAVGHFSERTRDGAGYLEDLFVLREYRMRGIATALVHRAAASARSKGARFVFLPADAGDTPKETYARMGFTPVYALRNYWKPVA